MRKIHCYRSELYVYGPIWLVACIEWNKSAQWRLLAVGKGAHKSGFYRSFFDTCAPEEPRKLNSMPLERSFEDPFAAISAMVSHYKRQAGRKRLLAKRMLLQRDSARAACVCDYDLNVWRSCECV